MPKMTWTGFVHQKRHGRLIRESLARFETHYFKAGFVTERSIYNSYKKLYFRIERDKTLGSGNRSAFIIY